MEKELLIRLMCAITGKQNRNTLMKFKSSVIYDHKKNASKSDINNSDIEE